MSIDVLREKYRTSNLILLDSAIRTILTDKYVSERIGYDSFADVLCDIQEDVAKVLHERVNDDG